MLADSYARCFGFWDTVPTIVALRTFLHRVCDSDFLLLLLYRIINFENPSTNFSLDLWYVDRSFYICLDHLHPCSSSTGMNYSDHAALVSCLQKIFSFFRNTFRNFGLASQLTISILKNICHQKYIYSQCYLSQIIGNQKRKGCANSSIYEKINIKIPLA